jgi:hypothetical protein
MKRVTSTNRWLRLLFAFGILTCLVRQLPYMMDLEDQKVSRNNSNDEPTLPLRVPPKVEESSDYNKKTINSNSNNNDDGFGACLLIMDDNHFLIEWLAYHSYRLPLKHLIVAIDPQSKTSPSEILDRYRYRGGGGKDDEDGRSNMMTIDEWGDEDYMRILELEKHISQNASHHAQMVELYVVRQRMFYLQCMKTLKQANRTYVAIVDTDEFIVPNPNAFEEYNIFHNLHLPNNTATTNNHITIWDLLQMAKAQQQRNQTRTPFLQRLLAPCLPIARLQLSTKEEEEEQTTTRQHGFQTRDFLTLRYQHHFGLKNYQKNRKVKSIIDVSQVPPDEFRLKWIHAHRAIKTRCRYTEEYLGNRKSPIVAHHYVGTWDQWTFRDDPRSWTRKKRGKYQSLSGEGVLLLRETAATTWLDGFINKHGIDKARALLRDVGYVPPKTNNQSSIIIEHH